ncbi:MAG: tryptophan--tRNA ligase [Chitinivibrionales bacterium]|nr:tryptophan--tRNA ligase [Chitinivibrionales bacterium]
MKILSGIKPSGKLHIGNYLGMIKPMVQAQERGRLFCFIANLHSLTSVFDGNIMHDNTDEALLDLLALGIDPERSVLWVQSDVPEVTELTWYLNNLAPVGLLQRCHAYKDAVARDIPANNGLFSYPVLMAADILLYQSDLVPVGRDQKQHVEVTRDIAIRFNNIYGEIFTLPEAEIAEAVAAIPGLDGQKMSKSYDNTLEIFADKKTFRKKIMGIKTDSTPVEEPKDPDTSIIYAYYKLFATAQQAQDLSNRFRQGGMGYGDAKKELFELIWSHFEPFRENRMRLAKDPVYLAEVRKTGAAKARAVANQTLDRVRTAIGTSGN